MKTPVSDTFDAQVENVVELSTFDRHILNLAITSLQQLEKKLRSHHKLDNPSLSAQNTLQVLQNIQASGSLRPKYEHMFNQCVVLLVSYFSSAVGDVFRGGIRLGVAETVSMKLDSEEIKISIAELRDLQSDFQSRAANLFMQKRDISFQDMQSIIRSFKSFFGVEMNRDSETNDIIMGQASRHSIVHAGGIADGKMMNQIRDALPRTLKTDLRENDVLKFTPTEVRALGDVMKKFVRKLEADTLERTSRAKPA